MEMLAKTDERQAVVDEWLAQFESALAKPDDARLKNLFHADSHWRDLLALTWTIGTVEGHDNIVAALKAQSGHAKPSGFGVDLDRTPPRQVTRAGTAATEAIFRFETATGRGSGVVRLTSDKSGAIKAWTLLTAIEELKGHE